MSRVYGRRLHNAPPLARRWLAVAHSGKLGAVGALLLVGALCSCGGSRIPAYGLPTTLAKSSLSDDRIPYGTLVREDFKSASPPPNVAQYRDRMGAATCVTIQPNDFRVGLRRLPDGGYEARAAQLSFVALMDRGCSWWNESNVRHTVKYVLEHEQIHFALFEIGVRRLNADARQIEARTVGRSKSPRAASRDTLSRLVEETGAVMKRVIERSRQFDEETSLGYEPKLQREWALRVARELGE